MKAGCFIKILILGTIALGVVIYLVSTKGKEWILDPLKEEITAEAFETMPSIMSKFKVTEESKLLGDRIDSLITAFKSDTTSASINFSRVEIFLEELGQSSLDSVLSKTEYQRLIDMSKEIVSFKQKKIIEFNEK